MVSESWEKFRSRERNPLSSPKLPNLPPGREPFAKNCVTCLHHLAPSEVCRTLGIAACALA